MHTTSMSARFAWTLAAAMLGACGMFHAKNPEIQAATAAAADSTTKARAALNALKADPGLAARVPVELAEAEKAVKAAEDAGSSSAEGAHLAYIAERKAEAARALAQAKQAEDQIEAQRASGAR
jgi:hypothetical protein